MVAIAARIASDPEIDDGGRGTWCYDAGRRSWTTSWTGSASGPRAMLSHAAPMPRTPLTAPSEETMTTATAPASNEFRQKAQEIKDNLVDMAGMAKDAARDKACDAKAAVTA